MFANNKKQSTARLLSVIITMARVTAVSRWHYEENNRLSIVTLQYGEWSGILKC